MKPRGGSGAGQDAQMEFNHVKQNMSGTKRTTLVMNVTTRVDRAKAR